MPLSTAELGLLMEPKVGTYTCHPIITGATNYVFLALERSASPAK